jgi:hypothetical protein
MQQRTVHKALCRGAPQHALPALMDSPRPPVCTHHASRHAAAAAAAAAGGALLRGRAQRCSCHWHSCAAGGGAQDGDAAGGPSRVGRDLGRSGMRGPGVAAWKGGCQ